MEKIADREKEGGERKKEGKYCWTNWLPSLGWDPGPLDPWRGRIAPDCPDLTCFTCHPGEALS